MLRSPALFALVFLVVGSSACTDGTPADAGTPESGPVWTPGVSFTTARDANARGLLDRKGLIHAHSVYSHDACDGEPVKDGVRDQSCLDDFRNAVCKTKMDFVFLTDHRDAFTDTEFPDAILYANDRGDVLVERAGGPVANRAGCDDDAHTTLIMGGSETDEMMPVGVEGHPVAREGRGDLYGLRTPEHVATLHDAGALLMFAHPEMLSADEIIASELDGFEMYNLHRNLFMKLAEALDLAVRISEDDEGMPSPDLSFVRVLSLDDEYLEKWARVLAAGVQKVTTVGTDCHQNTFPGIMDDGERIDSYRRMMAWMSNHLLVKPNDDGTFDDRHLKEALAARRLYGAFEVFGPPAGFDFVARAGDDVTEMGGAVNLDDAPIFEVALPYVDGIEPDVDPPEVRMRLLRAEADGTWTEVAATVDEDLSYTPTTAGAYRAEVRIVPHHVEEYLGADDFWTLSRDHVWILANAILVR
jgi:hypothetical protein